MIMEKNVWYLLGQVTFSDETEISTIQSTTAAGIKGWWWLEWCGATNDVKAEIISLTCDFFIV